MQDVDLREYRRAAIEELDLVTQPDLDRWFKTRWRALVDNLYSGSAKADETINEIMRGGYDRKAVHLEILHRVLTLHDYGLSVEDAWLAPGETSLRHDLDGFRELLRAAKANHKDPLKLLREGASPRVALQVRVGPAPEVANVPMIFDKAESHYRKLGLMSDRIKIKIGDYFQPTLQTQARGRVILMSFDEKWEKFSVLNELLHVSRSVQYEAYKQCTFPMAPAGGEAGSREFIVVNWPATRDPSVDGLASLFEGKSRDVSVAEIRALGTAVSQTVHESDENRVWAATQPFYLSK